MPVRLAIILPCYNEEAVLPASLETLLALLDSLVAESAVADTSYIMCVDDGSHDGTWQVIERAHQRDRRVKGVSLAHNRGHQIALLAGIDAVAEHCDAAVTMDADLQDDPEAIRKMLKCHAEGAEVVYGVRSSRDVNSWFKRTSARAFYKFQRALGIDIVYDHADFRMMSARALKMLREYGESNLYLRGIVPQLGLPADTVHSPLRTRLAGQTKYPLHKMLSLAIDGITSFTTKPMRWIFLLGIVLLAADVAVGLWVFISYFKNEVMWGWSSLMLSVWFLGSLMLMALGIIGEYIGKIYMEVKHRPRYALRTALLD